MEAIFTGIYDFFRTHRKIFWIVFASVCMLAGAGASRIHVEEDITRFFPDDERVEKLSYIFKNSRISERLVFMVSVKDSSTAPQPDSLIAYTEELVSLISEELKPFITGINSQVEDSKIMEMIQVIQSNLPLYLEEEDYRLLDSLSEPGRVKSALQDNYRQLISPAGIISKRIVVNDPLGFSYIAFRKLQRLKIDDNVELYSNYLISKDHRHLLFFVQPVYGPNETGKNAPFIAGLDKVISGVSPRHPAFTASYFGATAVAAGNARQIQSDTILTLSLMVVLLAILLIGFFRKKRVPFLILIPVAFGGLFALCAVYLIQGHISVIAIAAGSIILGIAVNYSLHFLAHLKHTGSVSTVIKDLVKPMTVGSATTVLAFLFLQFVNASVLQDLGLFAAFSLIGAALCSLIFLPQLISDSLFGADHTRGETWLDKVTASSFSSSGYIVLLIFLITPVFFYFANQVQFNTDISQLNYMDTDLRKAQQRLETINHASLSSVYIVSQEKTMEGALRQNDRTTKEIQRLQQKGVIQNHSSVASFLISDSLQQIRLNRWRNYWTQERINQFMVIVRQQGQSLPFSEKIYSNFENMLSRPYQLADSSVARVFRKSFFADYIIEKNGLATIITLAHIAPDKKEVVYTQLETTGAHVFDRQMLTNLFSEYVHADFNFIVTFTSLLVFFALLISYGRIELTLITFIPMLITWIWILGIMAVAGIEFNIVNVMISTFIFGLGDDYSIFTMDGLQQDYALGKKNLPSIRTSIFLSALTTISGLGVLIFAKHPALRSIAGISIIGIVCVFIMSQTIEPFLFRWMITNRTSKGKPPMTFTGMVMTIFLFGFFITGSFLLTIIGLFLKLIPFSRIKIRLFYHMLIRFYTSLLVRLGTNIKVRTIGFGKETFSQASVIIGNHSSFLDILFTVMLHPKLILLTNKWVWNSPVFGGVVRLADYYPVMEGVDSIESLRERVKEGYSVVIFPEGTRSVDGTIGRFHKGAFYISEVLNIPVRPLLILGAGEAIPKGDFYVNEAYVEMKFLPPVLPDDKMFGESYSARTKSISRYFKDEYRSFQIGQLTPDRIAHKVIKNYLFKGPVLEWYMRIKLRLEKNYLPFHDLIPAKGKILDLGCGYGFLCYMLACLSDDRQLTGVDYDEEKISVANTGFLKRGKVDFFQADIAAFPINGFDVIIIADVLHYLTPDVQEKVLRNCFSGLNKGGKIIIRDGNTDLESRHQGTRITELFSVKLLRFNKSANELHFLSGKKLTEWAGLYGFDVLQVDETRFTSNVIFVLSHPGT